MDKYQLLIPVILFSCISKHDPSQLEKLREYEGKYEYFSEQTLDMLASEMDTTLYAVIENAKYPLKQIENDSFVDIQDSPVVFKRNNDVVNGYKIGGEFFDLLSKEFERMETLPRRELFHDPESYSYEPPVTLDDGLISGDIQNTFDRPELLVQMIKETLKGAYPDVHSILILKDDKLVLDEYFYGYDKDTPHQLRSATKPFVGCLVGIAVEQGAIKSEKDKILPYFDSTYEEIKNPDPRKENLTIENFLTYRHGMDCENNNPESQGSEQRMMQSDDWVKYTLDLPMVGEGGSSSSYCTGCALTLGSLVEIATGESIEEFAKEYLFSPMGIVNYNWRFAPNKSSTTTFSQMSITPRDLVKLAKMYLNKGKWEGKQILSESWVEKTFKMDEGDYGYLWEHKYFVIDGVRYNSYMASGNGGQKINIWPELDMITVFTGGNYNSYLLYGKSTPPNEMIPKYILNAL